MKNKFYIIMMLIGIGIASVSGYVNNDMNMGYGVGIMMATAIFVIKAMFDEIKEGEE